jgi:hypothetical protein
MRPSGAPIQTNPARRPAQHRPRTTAALDCGCFSLPSQPALALDLPFLKFKPELRRKHCAHSDRRPFSSREPVELPPARCHRAAPRCCSRTQPSCHKRCGQRAWCSPPPASAKRTRSGSRPSSRAQAAGGAGSELGGLRARGIDCRLSTVGDQQPWVQIRHAQRRGRRSWLSFPSVRARRYSSSLSKRCTHLICDSADPPSEKLSTALAYRERWGLHVVRSSWIQDSRSAGRRAPEAPYLLVAPQVGLPGPRSLGPRPTGAPTSPCECLCPRRQLRRRLSPASSQRRRSRSRQSSSSPGTCTSPRYQVRPQRATAPAGDPAQRAVCSGV